jgi:hypothetical protein
MSLQQKKCVFCGNPPEKKNKEHVIPQWLIKFTGDINRKITLGVDYQHMMDTGELRNRSFSFNAFHFPACEACNTKYSKLEDQAKFIFHKIVNKEFIDSEEVDLFLDWMDKVRVGLWLANLLLNKDILLDTVNPKFHIEKRIGAKDRILVIYQINDDLKGIQFYGTTTPGFIFNPCCFYLVVNNLIFFNVSGDYIVSKNLGFPYASKFVYTGREDRAVVAHLVQGKEKIKTPIFRKAFRRASVEIYQHINSDKLAVLKDSLFLNGLYDTDYVRNNSLDGTGKSSIFILQDEHISKLENDEELVLTNDLTFDRKAINEILKQQLFEIQLSIIEQIPEYETEEGNKKENVRRLRSVINLHKKYSKIM